MITGYHGFIYTCDACGASHQQENSLGHYTNSVPPKWSNFRFQFNAFVADIDGFTEGLLCESCTTKAIGAVQVALNRKEATDK